MRRRIVWADSSRSDYLDIVSYIALKNPDAAERIASRIEAAVAGLAEFATGRAGRVAGTYEKVVSGLPYIVAYALVDEPKGSEQVAILHIIHTARDWLPDRWPE